MKSQELIIEAGQQERNYWLDLWRYRELFRVLAWRDLAVRYKQTVIGVAWAVIRPLVTVLIFTLIFGRIAKLPSDGSAPYPLMVFAGMLPWTFFASGLSEASNSLVNSANLISKVYFPKLIVPTATVVVAFTDFLITFAMLIVLMAWFNFWPDWHLLLLPGFTLLAFIASMGPALWISALNVKYRDFRYIVPFIAQFGLYVSPVGFSSTVVPEEWRLAYSLNPMVGVIDGFPLVYSKWPEHALPARLGSRVLCRSRLFLVRLSPVPEGRKELCGSDLTRLSHERPCPHF